VGWLKKYEPVFQASFGLLEFGRMKKKHEKIKNRSG
jgi:hypothetical protein